MANARIPGPLGGYDYLSRPPGPLGRDDNSLAFPESASGSWRLAGRVSVEVFEHRNTAGSMGLDHRPIRVADAGKEDKPKQKGRVVRAERQPRRPPGPAYYTEEQLRDWYNFYRNAKVEFVELVNGKRTQAKA